MLNSELVALLDQQYRQTDELIPTVPTHQIVDPGEASHIFII